MATTGERIFALQMTVENKMTSRIKRILVYHRTAVLNEMQSYLDRVRLNAAEKQIIPTNYPNVKNPYVLAKWQKSTPGKLTERTGALIKMLKDITPWKPGNTRTRTMSGDAMQGTIKVTTKGLIVGEEYMGELRASIKSESKYWPIQSGKALNRPTKQQLVMRFKWETGIRGETRPFMLPAGNAEEIKTEKIIQSKINYLEAIK